MGSQPQVYTCDLAFSRWLLTGLYQCTSYCELQWEETNIPGWKWKLGIKRKSQGFLMQRTLALISAAWICSRETEAEGQPSPSCAVSRKAETLGTAHSWVIGSIIQDNFIQKNQSWQTRNKLEWNMDEPPEHPSIGTQLFRLGYANSIEHTGRHRAFFIVWCLKDWFLLDPKRHWSRRLCYSTISFQEDTLQDEAVPLLLGPVLQNATLTLGCFSCVFYVATKHYLFSFQVAFLSIRN